MLNEQLLNPKSIVVIGGSNDVQKPGGKILKNLLDNNYKGKLFVTNLKSDNVQGVKAYKKVEDIPEKTIDLAILAVAAKYCPAAIELLIKHKNTKAFIIISAGFSEESEEGAKLEKKIAAMVSNAKGCLIGPNCVGVLNQNHTSIFTSPIPKLDPQGCDFISGSGATAVFIMESGIPKGITFSSVFSVGNSAQIGVEDVLEYMDRNFDPEKSSKIKLLYIESIKDPDKLLEHASSLVRKGCKIAAIKSGRSEAGSRAASSHTGALASSDVAVDGLFRKAGIVRCYGREELTTVAGVFMHRKLRGKNIAIITHAGGPAVMLTDALSMGGLKIPTIEGKAADELLLHLYPGSSVANPIDFLATGTSQQLGKVIDFCNDRFDEIDAMVVIFGSPGLREVFDAYEVLHEKMKSSKKPVFPVLPSIITAKREVEYFLSKGHVNFPDEVLLGRAISKVYNTPFTTHKESELPDMDLKKIRKIVDEAPNGYLPPEKVQQLLDAAGINRVQEAVVTSKKKAVEAAEKLGYPLAMKVIGPIHKSDIGGVVLNVNDAKTVEKEYNRMSKLENVEGILLQPMESGVELFIGAKYEPKFGHMILCGLGGIFIEIMKDVNAELAPVTKKVALSMIKNLRGYGIIKGARGQEPVNEDFFADMIVRLSALGRVAREIYEMDLNPVLGSFKNVVAVDARIRIEKDD